MTGLAAVLAAVAVWLGGHRPSRRLRALESSAMREPGPAARRVGVLMGRLAIVVVTTAAAGLVLGAAAVAGTLALAVMAVAGARLRHRATARAESAALRGRVIEACAVLAADLRAGRPAADALDAAAGVCAELAPAVVAARLGGDRIATHLTPLSTGVDLVAAILNISLGKPPDVQPRWHCGAAIRYFNAERSGAITAVRGLDDIPKMPGFELLVAGPEGGAPLRPGFRIPTIQSSLDRYGYALFSGADANEAAARADRAVNVEFELEP